MKKTAKGLHSLKWAWAAILCAVPAFIPNAPAHANNALQTMHYGVYAGGFRVVDADFVIDTSKPGDYALEMRAKTDGALGKLAPWSGSFGSQGWVMQDGKFIPQQHMSVSTWRDETETKTYTYTKDQNLASLIVKDHDKPLENQMLEDELTQGTTDVMSATLATLQNVSQGQRCSGSSDIFDGKRRFNLAFKPVAQDRLPESKYNAYAGPAEKCTAEVTPVAGHWREKPRGWLSIQEQGRDKGTIPTVWMAQLNPDAPAIPVKVMAKTDYGVFMMHLEEYKSGDTVVMSDKRKKALK